MSNFGTVYNNCGNPRSIYTETGSVVEIQPYSKKGLPLELAQEFISKYPGECSFTQAQQVMSGAEEDIVWVANMTGNKIKEASKDMVKHADTIEGKRTVVEFENPMREPIILSFSYWDPKKVFTDPGDRDVSYSFSYPEKKFVLYPYQRKPITETMALHIFAGISNQDQIYKKNKMQVVRAPAPFEPDDTWALDELCVYAKMLDTKNMLNIFTTPIMIERFKFGKKKTPLEEERAKGDLLKCLFFFIVDPEYILIEPKEFNDKLLEAKKKSSVNPGEKVRLNAEA